MHWVIQSPVALATRPVPALLALLVLLLGCVLGCGSDAPTSYDASNPKDESAIESVPQDQQGLLGDWRQILLNDSGRRFINEDEFKTWDSKCTITAETITWQRGVRRETSVLTYVIDSTKTPKWIDWRDEGREVLGIFEVTGDTLKICVGESGGRPKDFDPTGPPDDVLFVFRRIPEP